MQKEECGRMNIKTNCFLFIIAAFLLLHCFSFLFISFFKISF
jgi:hypothetical protein